MDICTLIVATIMSTQACYAPKVCEQRDNRIYCIGGEVMGCKQPDPYYVCIRPDGSKYNLEWKENIK